jgi:hypothetical protein
MVILFEIFDLSYMNTASFIDEASRYGDICELHTIGPNRPAEFFLAFGGTDIEKVINDIKDAVPIDRVECFKVTEYYGNCDEETLKWLESYIKITELKLDD